MVNDALREEIDPSDERKLQEIFDESRSTLVRPSPQRTQETVRKARLQAGVADCLTFLVRTGKATLYLLEGIFGFKKK